MSSNFEPGNVRSTIQIILAIALVVGSMVLVGAYIYVNGFEDETVKEIVKEAWTLLILGVGAALAIFGLGRTVTSK